MSTASTDTPLEGFTTLTTADRKRVSELITFYELLIKGQLEESLLLHDDDSEIIRKIGNAVNDLEEMSLLKKAFEEDPTLLHKLRETTGKKKYQSSKYLILNYTNNFNCIT